MICGTATFTDSNAQILAKLSTGETVEVYTALQADGYYKQWNEDMHPDGIGYYETFSEQEVDEDTATLLYPEEWEFVDEDKEDLYNDYENITIQEIVRIINVDWEVEENSICDEDDF